VRPPYGAVNFGPGLNNKAEFTLTASQGARRCGHNCTSESSAVSQNGLSRHRSAPKNGLSRLLQKWVIAAFRICGGRPCLYLGSNRISERLWTTCGYPMDNLWISRIRLSTGILELSTAYPQSLWISYPHTRWITTFYLSTALFDLSTYPVDNPASESPER
jgi:hypothetical protein